MRDWEAAGGRQGGSRGGCRMREKCKWQHALVCQLAFSAGGLHLAIKQAARSARVQCFTTAAHLMPWWHGRHA